MIDIIQFSADLKDPWIQRLGFTRFLHAKLLRIVHGGDEETTLKALNNKHPDLLLSPELTKRRDPLHGRASGLHQTILKVAKKKNVAVGFALHPLLQARREQRAILLGRMIHNVRLCRKYHVKMVLCSYAKDVYGLRGASDMQSFGRILGMTPQEAKDALDYRPAEEGVRFLS